MYHLGFLIFLTAIFTPHSNGQDCQNLLPKSCKCTRNQVECVSIRLNDTDIFLQIRGDRYPYVDTIIMTGGKFKSLNGNLFGPGNVLPAVTFLDLSHNHIEFVHGQALRGLPNLQSLILSHNSISVTESKPNHIDVPLASDLPRLKSLYLIEAFHQNSTDIHIQLQRFFNGSKLDQLRKLALDNNQLNRLPDRFLCQFPQLEELSLSNNYLRSFRADPDCIEGLVHLNLDGNNIQSVDSRLTGLIDRAPHLNWVNFSHNPFRCDCQLKSFINWMRESETVKSKEQLICAESYPSGYEQLRLLDVPVDKLRCLDDRGYIHGVYIVLGLVFLGLLVLLLCLLYKNFGKMCRQIKHHSPMRTSMGYSRIERETEVSPEMV